MQSVVKSYEVQVMRDIEMVCCVFIVWTPAVNVNVWFLQLVICYLIEQIGFETDQYAPSLYA